MRLKEVRMKKLYEKALKRKCFASLKQNRDESRDELAKLDRAHKFDMLWTKRICFEQWSQKLEQKLDIYQMHLVYKAKKHYEAKLVRNYLATWKCYVLEQREKKVCVFSLLSFNI